MGKEKRQVPELRFEGFDGEWIFENLSKITEFFSGLTYTPKDVAVTGVLVLRSSNIQNNKIVSADNIFVKADKATSENVRLDDIVVVVRNGSRSLIGKHALVRKNNQKTVIGAFMTGLRASQPYFLNSLLDTNQFSDEICKNLGATINQITLGMFSQMQFCIPTSHLEREKIGTFFYKLDEVIHLLEEELNKYKDLRKGYLAKMFPKEGEKVPELRFPGFSGEWEEKEFQELGKTFSGLTGKKKEDFNHGAARYVTYMNVYQNVLSSLDMLESVEIDLNQEEVRKGDVFFTTSSETPEEVGLSSVWEHEIANVYLNSFSFGFRPTYNFDIGFLAYMLRSEFIRPKIAPLAQGISRYNISKTKLMEIKVIYPGSKEQAVIGNFFRELDETIELKAQELEKYKDLKKAYLAKMFV